MDNLPDGFRLVVDKRDVDNIHAVQQKESKDKEWTDLKSEIKDVGDKYMIEFQGNSDQRYDVRILASKRSNDGPQYLLFSANEKAVIGELYKSLSIQLFTINIYIFSFKLL